ncbi:MAG: cation transporter [Fusobacterium sp.]|nr:cation transporter [Fusobacterium sp.]
MQKIIKIDGMGCEHCIKSVKEALGEVENLKILDVKIGEATIEIENEDILKTVVEKLDDAGYEVV